MQKAAGPHGADLILMDLGPNLGAINRAALIAADHVVIPLSPDLFSLQGLRNLGPTLRRWRAEWNERLQKRPSVDLGLPSGQMTPIGYIVQQHSVRLDRPVKAYDKWINRIPRAVLQLVYIKAAKVSVDSKGLMGTLPIFTITATALRSIGSQCWRDQKKPFLRSQTTRIV